MEHPSITPSDGSQTTSVEQQVIEVPTLPQVRTSRGIVVNPVRSRYVDSSMVSSHYYNSFNYAVLGEQKNNVHLALGVTSANRGEGKTLTASNLAVSLTLGYQRKTVLVDLNPQLPCIHKIFGAPVGPGLMEALDGGEIHVSPTSIENLSVLSAGNVSKRFGDRKGTRGSLPLGVEYTTAFGDVIHALQDEFNFIIVDMPAICMREFPVLFINHLDGVLVVVEAGKTKGRDIEKMLHRLHKDQVLGFVFNRVKDDDE
jgi:Mrp family chromosome partitioning ATPase